MIKLHLERGKRFECPVEIFQFVYSDWCAADKVTGGHWNVEKYKNKFKGGRGGFWAEFDLVHHEFDGRNGTFTYFVTLSGKLINGNGKLIIEYSKVDKDLVYGEGNIDIEIKGFLSTLLGKIYQSKLHNLTDDLVSYQHDACINIAKEPQAIMGYLSQEQQKELAKYLKGRLKEDIFESKLEIIPLDGTWFLNFETPIPIYQRLKEKVEIKETYPEFLNRFNNLIEGANNYYTLSRSLEPDRKFENVGKHFNEEIKILGNDLYRKYISGEIKVWLKSMFKYKKNANIRVRIEAEGNTSLLPWELLHDGDDFLCLKSSTFRVEFGQSEFVDKDLDIKGVLVVTSNPLDDLENVETEGEVILNSIKDFSGMNTKLLSGDNASKENVIKEIKSGKYQVMHYSGHSNFEEKSPGSSFLLMKDEKHLMADELARLSKQSDLRLVFLNSCFSGASKIDLFDINGLASAFVKTGVPYVIGMKWSVTDEGATLLSEKFYNEYISFKDPVEALMKSRIYVGEKTEWKDPAWAAPVIYTAQ